MQLSRAMRYVFLDPTWPTRLAFALAVLVLPTVIATVLDQLFDSVVSLAIIALALIVEFCAGAFLYYRYFRITAMVAIEGRDLPLPGQEPILDTIERAIRLIVFGLILAITMIPLLCIMLCPLALVGGLLFDSNGGTVSFILAWAFFSLTVGLAFVTYQLVGQARYFITGDFGGSLNPATLFRTVRFNLTDWLLAALFPILISLGSALLRELLIDPITDDQWLSYAINTVLTIPIAIYTTLVQFHLAGQAYRLSQPSTQAAAF